MRCSLVIAYLVLVSCGPSVRSEGKGAGKGTPAQARSETAGPAVSACTDAASCERGCEAGRATDCHKLAERKLRGRGTAMDPAGAERLLERACAAKLRGACADLAYLQLGAGRAPAVERAMLVDACPLEGQVEAVEPRACAAAALWLWREPDRDVTQVADLSKRGCEAGDLIACSILEELLRLASSGADKEQAGLRQLLALIEDTRTAACKSGRWEACGVGADQHLAAVRRACTTEDDYAACAELASVSADPAARARALRRACDDGRVPSACDLRGDELRDGMEDEPSPEAARRAYQIACAGGVGSSCIKLKDPQLGAGCAAIDMPQVRNPTPARLGRLRGERWGGGRFDSNRDRQPRLYLFTASWNHGMRIPDAIFIQQALGGRAQVVVVLSDADWTTLRDEDLEALRAKKAEDPVVVLDPPRGDEAVGPRTRALGIEKVTEAMLVDRSGRVILHLAGMQVGKDRRNTVLCIDSALKPAGNEQP